MMTVSFHRRHEGRETMAQTRAATHTETFRDQYGISITEGLTGTATAAATGDWRQAAILAERFRSGGRHLHTNVVRDALTAGVDWWALGDMLSLHPQAAYTEYGNLVEGLAAPAQQRPHLAVILTAGLAAVHDMEPEYGIDIEDLDASHSITFDPKVRQLCDAANLLAEDIWITVTLPGDFEGAEGDPTQGEEAIVQWTSVVLHADELEWLREVLALNAAHDDEDDEDLDPLD